MKNLDRNSLYEENEDLVNGYFDWLTDHVCPDGSFLGRDACGGRSYSQLLAFLFGCKFFPRHEMDENRANDGLSLRFHYTGHAGDRDILTRSLDFECTILELLIALAERLESVLWEDDGVDRPWRWFWMFIENMGLAPFYDERWSESQAAYIIDNFNNGAYNRKGGPFTNDNFYPHAGDVDLWTQMNTFIRNYLDY